MEAILNKGSRRCSGCAWGWRCAGMPGIVGSGLAPPASPGLASEMNERVQDAHGVIEARRASIIQVMRNDEVAMPCRRSRASLERAAAAPQVVERGVDAGADRADGAELVDDASPRSPKRCASAARTRASSCRFSREIDQRQPVADLRAAACRRRRARRGTPADPLAGRSAAPSRWSRTRAGACLSRSRRRRPCPACAADRAARPCRRRTGSARAAGTRSRARRWRSLSPWRTRRPAR